MRSWACADAPGTSFRGTDFLINIKKLGVREICFENNFKNRFQNVTRLEVFPWFWWCFLFFANYQLLYSTASSKNDKLHVRILVQIRGNMKRNKKMGSSLYDFTNYDVTKIEEEEEINNLR